jgi:acyl carrier protein
LPKVLNIMPDRNDILQELRTIVVRVKEDLVPPEAVVEQATLQDLQLDSLDLLEMRFDLDRRWGLQVTDEEAKRVRTIADIIDLVMAVAAKKAD